jgi:DNA-directed RNA polymerase subunit RPC12/RpoP
VGCRCLTCGTELHDYVPADSEEHRCRQCGFVERHAFTSECRWEDWGGWDSVGPWKAQENEYMVCRRCGYEEFARFTDRIQF